MPSTPVRLPGYRAVLLTVASLYLTLALLNLAQGAGALLGPFGFEAAILRDPLLLDFYHWHFVLMANLGVLLGLLGWLVREPAQQRLVARVMCVLQLHYAYLDFRTSVWGSGLYADPRSLLPLGIGVLFTLAFAWLSFRPYARAGSTTYGK